MTSAQPAGEGQGAGRGYGGPIAGGSNQDRPDQHEPAGRRRRSFTLRDLLVLVFYQKRIILIFSLLPIAIGFGAALMTKTQYTAEGLLLVMVNRQSNPSDQDLTGGGPSVLTVDGLKAVESEIQIIRSSEVVKQVLTELGPYRLFPRLRTAGFLGFVTPPTEQELLEKATELFRERLSVEVQSDTNILSISFRHPDPALAAEAVNLLTDVYLERRRELYADPRSPFLIAEVERFGRQLKDVEGQIEQVKIDFGVIDIDQEVLLAVNQVDTILQRSRQIRERREAAIYEAGQTAQDLAAAPETLFDFNEDSNQSDNNDDHNLLIKLLLDRDHLASQYTADYPAVKDLDRTIATLRKAMKTSDTNVYFTRRTVRNPLLDFLNRELLNLRAEGGAIDRALVELEQQRDAGLKRIDELRDAQLRLSELDRQRDIIDEIYRQYVVRAEAARIEEEAAKLRNSNVTVVQWASPPVTGTSLSFSFLLAGIVGGCLVGAAAGSVATALKQVYILPSEAEDDLGMACLAEFSEADVKSPSAETRPELLYLASTLLDVSNDGRPLGVVQFIPLGPKDGASALLRALATELSQGRGLRTLLIDLGEDWRDQLRALGAVDRTATVADVLPVAATAVPQLWIAAEPAASPLLSLRTALPQAQTLMQQLREQYDIVLFGAAPAVFDAQSRRLAMLVDANVLVIRAELTRGPAAKQIRNTVLRTGGDLLGFVFTGRRYYIPKAVYRWL